MEWTHSSHLFGGASSIKASSLAGHQQFDLLLTHIMPLFVDTFWSFQENGGECVMWGYLKPFLLRSLAQPCLQPGEWLGGFWPRLSICWKSGHIISHCFLTSCCTWGHIVVAFYFLWYHCSSIYCSLVCYQWWKVDAIYLNVIVHNCRPKPGTASWVKGKVHFKTFFVDLDAEYVVLT